MPCRYSLFTALGCFVFAVAQCQGAESASATQPAASSPPVRIIPQAPPPPVSAALPPGAVPPPDKYLAWDSTTKTCTVSNGAPEAEFSFNVTNISSEAVTITTAFGSCGCTVPKLPSQPWKIAPGAGGEIPVVMNLAGKFGKVIKTVTVVTDKGNKQLLVTADILPPAPSPMTPVTRAQNLKIAVADRQAVFKNDCARCHAVPSQGKLGKALFDSACGICHEAEHRATMVPDLHAIPQVTNAEFWRNWIMHGKPGSLMPAFSQQEGGILNDAQIASLVSYLTATIPSHPAAQAARPAMAPE